MFIWLVDYHLYEQFYYNSVAQPWFICSYHGLPTKTLFFDVFLKMVTSIKP